MLSRSGMRSRVNDVREFNRFYTREVGALNEGLLESSWSLTEVRVLYEIANRAHPTPSELSAELGVDPGYLSRILRRFQQRRLIRRTRSASDGRETLLSLTSQGKRAFAKLDARARDEVANRLAGIGAAGQRRLIAAMKEIRDVLEPRRDAARSAFTLRAPVSGDLGWVVHRHGALYWEEFGWDQRFEGLVAGIVASFARDNDPRRERCWIADRDGEVIGSVFLVRKTATVAQLRLLLVEPSARGLGLGARLVDECIAFARNAGYRKIMLWTHGNLLAAREIYRKRGFSITSEERYEAFGHDLVSETWELAL